MPKADFVGVRGDIADPKRFIESLQNLRAGQGLALNAQLVCGIDHLRSAVAHATRAFERGKNVSSTLSIETLLYASGERQISKAMEKMGIAEGAECAVIVFFDVEDIDGTLRSLGLERDDSVIETSKEKVIRFGITKNEIDMVPEDSLSDLVLERIAFVEIQKR
jgi:KEOPS complex subunit Cgi121